jgi:predicted DNA-binding transcriptional regulator AlpA
MGDPTKESQRDRLLKVGEAAEFLQLSESWMNKARLSGSGPEYHKMGRSVRYGLQDLEAFKRANARRSTSEYDSHSGPGRPPKKGK